MINWIMKKMGYHVCETFTQWEVKHATCSRIAMINYLDKRIWFEKYWQERKCTVCGKIEQEDLEWGGKRGDNHE